MATLTALSVNTPGDVYDTKGIKIISTDVPMTTAKI